MPLLADGLKCTLAPANRADYPGVTDAQWARLASTFPSGVCDWSERPQGVTPLEGTWLDFGTTEAVDAAAPVVAGTARVGEVVTAQVQAPEGATVAYQWIADGAPIAGAVEASFAPTADLVGAELTVRATVSADDRVAVTLVSDPTGKVKKAPGKP
jgi:hypothetical protein